VDKLSRMLPVCHIDWLDPEFNHSVAVSFVFVACIEAHCIISYSTVLSLMGSVLSFSLLLTCPSSCLNATAGIPACHIL
jgi:hypothetical protein